MNDNWLTANDHGTWIGVTTDSSTHYVTGLSLRKNDLIGTLPTEVGAMTSLTNFDLHGNYLVTGTLPSELGALTSLTNLSLYFNALTGTLPTELSALTSLTQMLLHFNDLTGSLPTELGGMTSLTRFLIQNNDLTGPIPDSVCELPTTDFQADCNICDDVLTQSGCCDGCLGPIP